MASLVAIAALASGCSFLLDFPSEGESAAEGGGGGGEQCEPNVVEACSADATATASACDAGTRSCAEDGTAFGACECGAATWSSSFSSATGSGSGASIAVGPDGSVVVAGVFSGSINLGGSTLTAAGDSDLFLAKFSADGAHQWSDSFGDTLAQETPPVVAVDSTGAIVWGGRFRGTLGLGGDDLEATGTAGNIFLAKFDPDGSHVWSVARGEDAEITDIAIGPTDGIAVGGLFNGVLTFQETPDFPLLNETETIELFLARLDTDGEGIWEAYVSTDDLEDDKVFVEVGPSDETIMSGVFVGALESSADQNGDQVLLEATTPAVYVQVFDHTLLYTVLWAEQFQGSGTQVLTAIDVDDSGDVVLAGHYKGTLTAGSQPELASTDSSENFFLVKLAGADGEALFSVGLDESGATLPSGVAIHSDGDITVAGSMNGGADFGGGTIQLAEGATEAAFIARFDSGGTHVWSKGIGAADALLSIRGVADDRSGGGIFATGSLVGALELPTVDLTGTDDVVVGRFAP